jgi:hypothetical protein
MTSAPVDSMLSGVIALTVAAVPTGIKAGVRIAPRPVLSKPIRASPFVARTRKSTPPPVMSLFSKLTPFFCRSMRLYGTTVFFQSCNALGN